MSKLSNRQLDELVALKDSELKKFLRSLPDEARAAALSQLGNYRPPEQRIAEARELASNGDVRPWLDEQFADAIFDDFQIDALSSVMNPQHRETFLVGATGSGKTCIGGLAAVCKLDCEETVKVLLLRDSFDSCQRVLFGEVLKWWRKLSHSPAGVNAFASSIQCEQQPEARFIRVISPDSDEGCHGQHGSTVIMDEASADTLQARYRIVRTMAKTFAALGNPRVLPGNNFRDAFDSVDPYTTKTIKSTQGLRRCIVVDGSQYRNVKEQCLSAPVAPIGGIEIDGQQFQHGDPIPDELWKRPIIPGQTCLDGYLSLLHDPDPFVSETFAKCRWPESDKELSVFDAQSLRRSTELFDEIELARRDNRTLFTATAAGLDVATSGDKTMLAVAGRMQWHDGDHLYKSTEGVFGLHECSHSDTTEIVEWCLAIMRERYHLSRDRLIIAIDVDGLGIGVADMIRQRSAVVIPIRGNAASKIDTRRYANLRAQLFGELAKRIDIDGQYSASPYALPSDSLLSQELMALQRISVGYDGSLHRITPKTRSGAANSYKGRTLREQLGRSPDRADASAYAHYAHVWSASTISAAPVGG